MALATPEEKEKLLRTLKFEIQSLLSTEKEAITAYQLLSKITMCFISSQYLNISSYNFQGITEMRSAGIHPLSSWATGHWSSSSWPCPIMSRAGQVINELVSGQRKKKSKGKRPSFYGGRYSARPASSGR